MIYIADIDNGPKKNPVYRLNKSDLTTFIRSLATKHNVFVPDKQGSMVPYKIGLEIGFDIVPVWGSMKEFVFPAHNLVAGTDIAEKKKKTVIFGLRNCDIKALSGILDNVFLKQEPADPIYRDLRENIIIASFDCASPADTCFCSQVGGAP